MSDTAKDRFNKVLKDLMYVEKVRTKIEFAALLGYDVSYVSQLLNGKRDFTDRICKRVFEKTGVSPEWLKTGEGKMFATKRDNVLHREGDPPMNDIDLSAGVKNVDYDAIIVTLLTKRKDDLKRLIDEVLKEKGSI